MDKKWSLSTESSFEKPAIRTHLQQKENDKANERYTEWLKILRSVTTLPPSPV